MTSEAGLVNLTLLCEQFQTAYEAGYIYLRLLAPVDDDDDLTRIGARPRLPVVQCERRKEGDPALTIDRSLIA